MVNASDQPFFDQFAKALLDPDAAIPPGPATGQERRFGIYRNNVTHGLATALADSFPMTARLVGDAFFRAMATLFLRNNPPDTAILAQYGATFPDFIAAFPPAAPVPYLADMARLEWCWLQSYHAAHLPFLPVERLAGLPAATIETANLLLQPSLFLLQSRWPVASIWQDMRNPAAEKPAIDMRKAEQIAIYRQGPAVQIRLLPGQAFALLQQMQQGQSLGQALLADKAALQDQQGWLALVAGIFAEGLVTGINVAGQSLAVSPPLPEE